MESNDRMIPYRKDIQARFPGSVGDVKSEEHPRPSKSSAIDRRGEDFIGLAPQYKIFIQIILILISLMLRINGPDHLFPPIITLMV